VQVFGRLPAARVASSEGVAEIIFQAVTDGTQQLRYVATPDIQPLVVQARRWLNGSIGLKSTKIIALRLLNSGQLRFLGSIRGSSATIMDRALVGEERPGRAEATSSHQSDKDRCLITRSALNDGLQERTASIFDKDCTLAIPTSCHNTRVTASQLQPSLCPQSKPG